MIWRSGRPTSSDYKFLVKQGIKIIINLENNDDAIEQDVVLAKKAGLKLYSFPMSGFFTPNDKAVDQILGLLKNPQGKTLVHCQHGQDRTGLIVGLERVFIEGWTPEQAYQEMLDKGFHKLLFGLDRYYKAKTGL